MTLFGINEILSCATGIMCMSDNRIKWDNMYKQADLALSEYKEFRFWMAIILK